MRFLGETHVPFLKYRWVAGAISLALILGGLGVIVAGPGLNLGIDFVGGTQVTVKFVDPPDLARIRTVLQTLETGEPVVQRFDEPEKHEVLIRVENPEGAEGDFTTPILEALDRAFNGDEGGKFDLNLGGSQELASILAEEDPDGVDGDPDTRREHYLEAAEKVMAFRKDHGIFRSLDDVDRIEGLSDAVRAALRRRCTTGKFSMLGAESVGPAVGRDLREKARLAILFSLVGMLVYIWIRFQLPYGIGAVVALFHDVAITLGALALTQREINLPTIAALLTLVGYSVNDTVVVFDRVRENLKLKRGMDLQELMDLSINQTLSRTIITSGTTLMVVLSLYLFGGDVINTFAFVLLVGIIVGTYSSIFVASPVALGMIRWRERWSRSRRKSRRRR